MDEKRNTIKEVDIEAAEQDTFSAYGYARLKVQRGDETLAVKVRVTSVPTDELDRLRKKAPKPPAKKFVDPQTRGTMMIPDLTDNRYLEEMEEHNRTFTREVVGRGVAANLKMKDGTTAATPEQKWIALEERGLSGPQFAELTNTILSLTQWTDEEREKFL